jgi:hypothetical protein
MTSRSTFDKLKGLIIGGVALTFAGLLLQWLHICPIVKGIWTSSYRLYSGGLVILMLAGFYAVAARAVFISVRAVRFTPSIAAGWPHRATHSRFDRLSAAADAPRRHCLSESRFRGRENGLRSYSRCARRRGE